MREAKGGTCVYVRTGTCSKQWGRGWGLEFSSRREQSVLTPLWPRPVSLQVHLRSARRLCELCCANRGTFIKVGQHLGALDYLLPEEYTSTLKVLHSQAPQSSMQEVRQVIREDLGKEVPAFAGGIGPGWHVQKRPWQSSCCLGPGYWVFTSDTEPNVTATVGAEIKELEGTSVALSKKY